MKKKVLATGLLTIMTAMALSGCGSSVGKNSTESVDRESAYSAQYDGGDLYNAGAMDQAAEADETAPEEESVAPQEAGEGEVQEVSANRKLIKTVSMSVETKEFDTLTANLKEKVEGLGGYMESSYISGRSTQAAYDETRYASYTIRIPAAKLDSFVTQVSKISNIISKNENIEDITLNYVDLKSKKETLEIEKERLMVLLEKADSIETIVALESRLTEIRYQLESMESQLRTYDNLVDYATVNIDVNEVERETKVTPQSSFEKMANGFSNSIYNIGIGFRNFFIAFVIAIPYLIVWGIIILLFIIIVRICIKQANKKHEKLNIKGQEAIKNQTKEQTSGSSNENKD